MDRANRGLGWIYLRHPGIQLRPLRRAEKRDRLGLSGVEPQGGCLCKLWQRHGRARRPAASRNRNRASNGADPIIRPHPRRHALGTFPGGDVAKGLTELEKSANVMIDDLLWWTVALKAARER